MLKKLYKQEYGCNPPSPKALDTAAPAAPFKSAIDAAKAKEAAKSEISDNYDDDFDGHFDKDKKETPAEKKGAKKDSDEDDWGEDDWGEPNADFRKDEKPG